MKQSVFIGVDVSKKTLDVCYRTQTNAEHQHQTFSNTTKGYAKLLSWIKKGTKIKQNEWVFCMEHTGMYSLPLACFLQEKNIPYCVESAYKIKHSMGIIRGKSDKADAQYICRYTYLHKEELIFSQMPAKILMKLRVLLSHRERLVAAKVKIVTVAKELKGYLDKDICSYVSKDSEQAGVQLEKRIKTLEEEIISVIESDKEIKKNFDLATSVKGVGMFTALYMIIYTKNFTVMNDSRKFACYSGIAPYENSSGTALRGKHKVSHVANKKMKALLSSGACAAVRADKEIKSYYNRKIGEGKHKMSVLNAIKNKIVSRVFAVVDRGTPYVSIFNHC